jgi:hypothetical protein
MWLRMVWQMGSHIIRYKMTNIIYLLLKEYLFCFIVQRFHIDLDIMLIDEEQIGKCLVEILVV